MRKRTSWNWPLTNEPLVTFFTACTLALVLFNEVRGKLSFVAKCSSWIGRGKPWDRRNLLSSRWRPIFFSLRISSVSFLSFVLNSDRWLGSSQEGVGASRSGTRWFCLPGSSHFLRQLSLTNVPQTYVPHVGFRRTSESCEVRFSVTFLLLVSTCSPRLRRTTSRLRKCNT